MLANFLIGLREGLEAALVVSILIAYLVKSDRRHLLPRIWVGVGIAVARLAGLRRGADLRPQGPDLRGAGADRRPLSIIAVGFVTWMIFWMARAARSHVGRAPRARSTRRPRPSRWSLVVVAMLAVGREGLETALFLWAATQAAARDTGSTTTPLIGAALGSGGRRAARLPDLPRRDQDQPDQVLHLDRRLPDRRRRRRARRTAYTTCRRPASCPASTTSPSTSPTPSRPGSWYGTLLKGIFNFSPATTKLEAAAWLRYLVPTLTSSSSRSASAHTPRPVRPRPRRCPPEGTDHAPPPTRHAAALVGLALLLAAAAGRLHRQRSERRLRAATAPTRGRWRSQATDNACDAVGRRAPRRAS